MMLYVVNLISLIDYKLTLHILLDCILLTSAVDYFIYPCIEMCSTVIVIYSYLKVKEFHTAKNSSVLIKFAKRVLSSSSNCGFVEDDKHKAPKPQR